MTDLTGAPRSYLAWDREEAEAIVARLAHLPGASLPILHALQEVFGYIHDDAIPLVADGLNLSRAEVVGIVSFYHDFRREPPGDRVLRLCMAEACQAMGAVEVAGHLEGRLGVTIGNTTPDRSVTLEAVYCLGNCALSPAVMLDGRVLGRMTAARVDALLGAGPA